MAGFKGYKYLVIYLTTFHPESGTENLHKDPKVMVSFGYLNKRSIHVDLRPRILQVAVRNHPKIRHDLKLIQSSIRDLVAARHGKVFRRSLVVQYPPN